MRRFLIILLSVELLVAILLGQCGSIIHRRDSNQAFSSWYENPTPENRAELDRQRHINVLYDLGISAVAFGSMAVVTLLAYYAVNRLCRGSPDYSRLRP
jgi:uncharacterized protein YceK